MQLVGHVCEILQCLHWAFTRYRRWRLLRVVVALWWMRSDCLIVPLFVNRQFIILLLSRKWVETALRRHSASVMEHSFTWLGYRSWWNNLFSPFIWPKLFHSEWALFFSRHIEFEYRLHIDTRGVVVCWQNGVLHAGPSLMQRRLYAVCLSCWVCMECCCVKTIANLQDLAYYPSLVTKKAPWQDCIIANFCQLVRFNGRGALPSRFRAGRSWTSLLWPADGSKRLQDNRHAFLRCL